MNTRLRPIPMLCKAIQAHDEAGITTLDEPMLGDVQELVDRLDEVGKLLSEVPRHPYLTLSTDNRVVILRNAAQTWHRRCETAALRKGSQGRLRQLEAFLQATFAVLTCTRVITHDDAERYSFLVMVGRGEEIIDRWAAERTDAEAAEDCNARAAGLAQDLRERGSGQ